MQPTRAASRVVSVGVVRRVAPSCGAAGTVTDIVRRYASVDRMPIAREIFESVATTAPSKTMP